MARKKSVSKKKLTKKDIIILCIVSVLIIAVLVILTTDNKLNNYLIDFLSSLENDTENEVQPTPNSGGEKVYTSILSGKGNITLPSYFDTQSLLEVHFVDIGQGDAIVINFPDKKTMLIDSGSSTTGLADIRSEYLQYLDDVTDNKVIEYMVVTHPDTDHYNMLKSVVEAYQVQNAYYNEDTGTTYTQFLEVLNAEEGITVNIIDNQSLSFTIEGNGYKVTIYCCGDSAFTGASERNNQSLICLIEFGGRKILFTGDASTATEQWFIDEIDTQSIDVDVLKVGHHGSVTSTGTAFLNFIDTEYAIISCDDGTKHGHPDIEVMDRLSAYGIATYRTNRHGNILLYLDGDGDFGFLTEKNLNAENNTFSIDERKIAIAK